MLYVDQCRTQFAGQSAYADCLHSLIRTLCIMVDDGYKDTIVALTQASSTFRRKNGFFNHYLFVVEGSYVASDEVRSQARY